MIRSVEVAPKLRRLMRMSRVLAVLAVTILSGLPGAAHETRPAVADLDVGTRQVHLSITLALEAPLAGLDLDGLTDTDASPLAETYDGLRALSAKNLAELTERDWSQLAGKIALETAGMRLALSLDAVTVPNGIPQDLPRDSVLSISADLPPGDQPLVFSWDRSLGPVVLRQIGAGADGYTVYLTQGAASDPIPRGGEAMHVTAFNSFLRYVVLGYEHIVPKGADHILFVLGLFFFSTRLRPLLVQITAFTAAHTITLALATFGILSLPPTIVEPLIALSIAYIAFENIVMQRITPWRTLVVFAFGLLHGLGFASVLGDIGLSPGHMARSLVAFNIGVELGQISVIAVAYALVGYWFGSKPWYRARIAIPASAVIGLIGLYWFVERVAAQLT